ncbi:MAG: FAD:protein FMN transferase [Candidatus Delongbacteria bacterium]|nr:FAD:protein FMN transferase [Candidatus Delongbacteria bacterium]
MTTTFVEFTTDVTITAYGLDESDKEKVNEIFSGSKKIMEYFNQEMSPELETSTLSKLNKEAAIEKVKVPASLERILTISHNLFKYTDRSFDVALAPIIRLWGFSSLQEPKLPDPIKLIDLLEISSFDAIEYSIDSIFFSDTRCGIDLGGIGKGYAVDSVAVFLEDSGIDEYIVEAGGDLLVSSDSPKSIGIRHPREHGALIDTLYVANGAVATSGDYEKFFINDDTRYCHVIDPSTGYGVSDLASVTIITDKAYLSDAFATAVFVMGKDTGIHFLIQNSLSGLLIYKEDDGRLTKIDINLDRYREQ